MMYKSAYVIFVILAGIISYFIAKKRGMPHPGLWFIGGVIFNVFAVGAVIFIAKHFKSKKEI